MPIQGVSDRESLNPRFKTIGKLRKGGEKRGGHFGADLDHFRFTSSDPEVVNAFHDCYGEQPDHLLVYLPYATMEQNFSSWRELYGQNGLCKVRCDGANWVDWIEGDRHYHGSRPCESDLLDTQNRCPDCPLKPVGRLSVILPDLWLAGHIGLVTVETHGWNDIGNISAKLAQYEPLTGKPFSLWREMDKIGAPVNGKRAAVQKSLVFIELTSEHLIGALLTAQRRAQKDVGLLPGGEPYDTLEEYAIDPDVEQEPPYAIDDPLDDPELEPEPEPEPLPPYVPVPMPAGMKNEENVIAQAIKLMPEHYPNAGAVCTALYRYGGNEWKTMPVAELWQALNDAIGARGAS